MTNDINLSFENFITKYSRYKKFSNNKIAREIYELLSQPDNIYKMLLVSNENKPALSACIKNIEELYLNQNQFDLNKDFCRQAVGTMVKSVLEFFGMEPIKQKVVPKSKVFRTAAVYELLHEPALKLVTHHVIEKV